MVETPTMDKEPLVLEPELEAEKPGPVEEVVEEPEKPKAEKMKITERLFRSRISFCQKNIGSSYFFFCCRRTKTPKTEEKPKEPPQGGRPSLSVLS